MTAGEHYQFFLCLLFIVTDVIPSLQASGLARAAHQPLLGLMIHPAPALMLAAEAAEQWQ